MGSTAERYPEIIARLERVRSFEPGLDFDIAYLLDKPRVRFTYSQADVEAFLVTAIPAGEWVVKQVDKGFDAGVRHSDDDGWRHACENRTSARDNPATALTLAYLRGMAGSFT